MQFWDEKWIPLTVRVAVTRERVDPPDAPLAVRGVEREVHHQLTSIQGQDTVQAWVVNHTGMLAG